MSDGKATKVRSDREKVRADLGDEREKVRDERFTTTKCEKVRRHEEVAAAIFDEDDKLAMNYGKISFEDP
ncbi:hypothetical protein LguiA_001499 [Lonicera macranthoides]